MNAITTTENNAIAMTEDQQIRVLQTSLYPGASDASVRMVLSYCKAAHLDPMQKPVHIVPMWDGKAKQMRDVVMPGVNLYRTQAMRSGECAGVSEPEFGPDVDASVGGQSIIFPAWCRVTVRRRLPTGEIAEFTANERWMENYAVKGGPEKSQAPNAMWTKRPYGQLAKCAEAQALRKAFPELAAAPTAEEMEGKALMPDMAMPEAPLVDVDALIEQAEKTTTDADALQFWKDNNGKLTKQPADHAKLKEAIKAHRKKITDAQVVDVESREVAE